MTPMQLRARGTLLVASAAALTVFGAACADKQLAPAGPTLSRKFMMQLTATGIPAAQVSAGNLWLMVGALYAVPKVSNDDDGIRVLSLKFARITGGSQDITLPVDISSCLADNQRLGSKEACSMYLAAAVITDTFNIKDTASVDPFMKAYDYAFPVGPFDVAPGRAPTIPAIDMSLSRFGVREWVADEALRLGGPVNPNHAAGLPLAGSYSGSGAPALFALAKGADYSTPPSATTQLLPYPQLQIFENGVWRRYIASSVGSNANFTDVTAFSTSEAYIASSAGLWKFDGASFTKAGGIGDTVNAVGSVTASTGKLVIVGGQSGKVWIGNGSTFTGYTLPMTTPVTGVCITGANEAFAGNGPGSVLYRFDGTQWTLISNGSFGGAKTELQCPAAGQVYVLSAGSTMLRWLPTSGWVQFAAPSLSPGRGPLHWGVASASEMYAYADSGTTDRVYFKYNGSSWTSVGRERWAQTGGRLWADPRGGAAYGLSPFARLEKITSSGATVLSYQPPLRDAVMTSASSAFAVGWNLFLARWDGNTWTVDAPPAATPAVRILQGVWSDGPKNAWAVGNSSTIFRYDGSGWSVVSDVNKIITSVIDNYYAVWGSGSDVWIGGDLGITRCKSPTVCAVESSGGAIFSIWGSSSSNIFAVGGGGQIRRYNGTSWSSMSSPTTRQLARVSGSGPNDVWAVGDSVILHYDGTSWSNAPLNGLGNFYWSRSPSGLQSLFQLGLWVRGPKEVYMGGDNGIIERWDGTQWRDLVQGNAYRRRIIAITGGAGGCGIAITEAQTDSPLPTLWRGVGPSGCNASPMTPSASWP
jgi:hypothetical protein